MSAQPRLESKPFSATVDPMAAARVSPLSKQVRGPQRPNVQSSPPPTVIENKGNELLPTIRQNALNAAQSARSNIYDAQKMARQEAQNVRTDYRREDIDYHRENRGEDREIRKEGRGVKTKIDEEERLAQREQEKLDARTEAEKTILDHKAGIDRQIENTKWERSGKPLLELRKKEASNATAMVGIQATKVRAEIKKAIGEAHEKVINFENAQNLRTSISTQKQLIQMGDWDFAWARLSDDQKRQMLTEAANSSASWSGEGLDKGELSDVIARLPMDHLLAAKQLSWNSADSVVRNQRSAANAEMNKLLLNAETKLAALEQMNPDSAEDYMDALESLDRSLIPLVDRGARAYKGIEQGMIDESAPNSHPGAPPTGAPPPPSTGGSAIAPFSGNPDDSRYGDGKNPNEPWNKEKSPTSSTLDQGRIDSLKEATQGDNSFKGSGVKTDEEGNIVPKGAANSSDPSILRNTIIGAGVDAADSTAGALGRIAPNIIEAGSGAVDAVKESPVLAGTATAIAAPVIAKGAKGIKNYATNPTKSGQALLDDRAQLIKEQASKTSGSNIRPAGEMFKQHTPPADLAKGPFITAQRDPKNPLVTTDAQKQAATDAHEKANTKLKADAHKKYLNNPARVALENKGIKTLSKMEAFAKKHGIPPHPQTLNGDGQRSKRYDYYRNQIEQKVVKPRWQLIPERFRSMAGRTASSIKNAPNSVKLSAKGGLAVGGLLLARDIDTILNNAEADRETLEAARTLKEVQSLEQEEAEVRSQAGIYNLVDEMMRSGSTVEQIRTQLPKVPSDKATDLQKQFAYEYLDMIQAAEETGGRADSFNAPLPDVPISDANDTGAARIKP